MQRTSHQYPNGTVFLLDAISPRTLAACRSIGRKGVYVTCADESPFNLAFFSRYCQARLTYPSPLHSPQKFIEHLLDYLACYPQDCIIPVKEESLDAILAHRDEFERLTRLPFPPTSVFQVCRDKNRTMELADQLGIPHPKTVLPNDLSQVEELSKSLRPPLVIKPRMSCSGLGIHYVDDISKLYETYCSVHEQYPFPMIQEEIPSGEKFDVACLFDENSHPLATFAQKEVRSFPLRDGASTVQESVWRPDLVELTVQLLQKIGWSGIAEAEFMIDPRDGVPKLLEVNPRFWGSLQLSIQSGVDFPYLLYEWSRGKTIQPVHDYKVGQFCRQVLPYDLMHFLANPDRFKMEPSFFSVFDPNSGHNLFSADDLGPLLGFFLSCSRYVFDPDKWLHLARLEKFASQIGVLLHHRPKTVSSVTLDGLIEPDFTEPLSLYVNELDTFHAETNSTENENRRQEKLCIS
jgi:predicted ATP-grasp superfamily ATP-dependent carboligase